MADKNVQLINYGAVDNLKPKTDASLVAIADEDGDSSNVEREIISLRQWQDLCYTRLSATGETVLFYNARGELLDSIDLSSYALKADSVSSVEIDGNTLTFKDKDGNVLSTVELPDLSAYALKTESIAEVTKDGDALVFADCDGNTISSIDLSDLSIESLSENDVIAASNDEDSDSKGFLDYTGLRKVFELLKGMFLRVDEIQNLSEDEKAIARANLGIDSGGETGGTTESWAYYVTESRDADISTGSSYTPSSVFEYEMGFHNVLVYVDGLLTLEGVEWQEESTTSIKFLGDVSKDSTLAIYVRG